MPVSLSQKQTKIIVIAGLVILVLVAVFWFGSRSSQKLPQVKLKIWGIDNQENWNQLIQAYRALRPNVQIDYQIIDPKNYEENLLDALAAGRGPDVFMIHNRWLYRHQDKLVAADPQQIELIKFRELYPTVVEQDFILNQKIYALPLYLDTLALFYNKDLLDQAAITQPPKTWDEFQQDVIRLRQISLGAPTQQPISVSPIFTAGLRLGMNGNDVIRLQQLLTQNPEIYPEGKITGYFGPLTEKAVQRFQKKYGLVSSGTPATTGYGVVGPKTRQKLNEVFGAKVPAPRPISFGDIIKSGAAIGGSEKTIDHAADLLNLLMMQFGAKMTSDQFGRVSASFADYQAGGTPGLSAFNFYLNFANPASTYYTWKENGVNSLDSFSAGQTAMIFDYYSAVSRIKNKNSFLNFGTGFMLQPVGQAVSVNYADYWGLAVSRQSRNQTWAWDFILQAAVNPETNANYLKAVNRPPALRSLISQKLNDPEINVFAKQSLTARSWLQPDEKQVKDIFSRAITLVLSGQLDSEKALKQAQEQINQLYR